MGETNSAQKASKGEQRNKGGRERTEAIEG